jgi:hypothetical protein
MMLGHSPKPNNIMPYNIRKVKGGFKVCKKVGDKKCLPGKSVSKKKAQKRIAAVYMNESFDALVQRILSELL